MIPANDFVRKPRANQRHEIIREFDRVNHARSHVDALAQPALGNLAADIAGEDARHPIVTEPFAGFTPNYELDLLWPAVGRSLCPFFEHGFFAGNSLVLGTHIL